MNKKKENLMTLKHLLGIDEEKATLLMAKKIRINSAETDNENTCAEFISELLKKTFDSVDLINQKENDCDVEIILGNKTPLSEVSSKVFITWDNESFTISLDPTPEIQGQLPTIFLKLGAAFSCGAIITQTTESKKLGRGERYPIKLEFKKYFGADLSFLDHEVDLGILNIAGMGATGNWFVDGLSLMNTKGKLLGYDDDNVSDGNTQRTKFLISQVGMKKVFAYKDLFFPMNSKLEFLPNPTRIQDAIIEAGKPFDKIVCCVDSRAARRDIQEYAPRYVFDCSTTDISELTLFFGKLDYHKACLACLYFETRDEDARYKDIANVLGVELHEVKTERIDNIASQKIAQKYPEFNASELIGIPYDTFHKQLCGAGKLLPSTVDEKESVKNSIAPFCHVSVIAGLMLALEVTRRHFIGLEKDPTWNCWRINPWTTPQAKLTTNYLPNENCTFHLNSIAVAKEIWKNNEQNLLL